jgi:putative ABC transport system ATP-binding protein
MGPSGSGKSTLLNILGLLDRPDAGSYRLDGVETTTLPEEQRARLRRERIGFVFQSFHLIPRLTAFENVELPLTWPASPRGSAERVARILAAVGLTPRPPPPGPALRGPAPAGRHRPGHGHGARPDPGGRAHRQPGPASGEEVIRTLEGLNARGLTLVVVTHDPGSLGGASAPGGASAWMTGVRGR